MPNYVIFKVSHSNFETNIFNNKRNNNNIEKKKNKEKYLNCIYDTQLSNLCVYEYQYLIPFFILGILWIWDGCIVGFFYGIGHLINSRLLYFCVYNQLITCII